MTHRSRNSSQTMNNTSEYGYLPNAGTVIANASGIVKTILNYLDHEELMKCRLVSQLWKEITEIIMTSRIIVITREIPNELTKRAIAQPELILPYLDLEENVQFISEFNEFYKTDSIAHQEIVDNLILQCSFHRDVLLTYNKNIHKIYSSPLKGVIKTKVAIFPSLPGIKIKHFSFPTEKIDPGSQNRTVNLSEIINVSKEELKYVILFMNNTVDENVHSVPSVDVPSILVSTLTEFYPKYKSKEYWGIALCGKRLDVALLKPVEKETFEIIKKDFLNQVERIKRCRIEDKKCVAFFFSGRECRCLRNNSILSLFKESFPNVPFLFFSDFFLFDLSIPDNNEEEIDEEQFPEQPRFPLQLELFLLVWFN